MGPGQKDFRIAKAVLLLHEKPACSLPELARSCGVSPSRLSHLFKNQNGFSVKRYRRNFRFHLALKMLALTDMPIKEIGYNLGYHHTSSFVRAFKFQLGLSPTAYRRRQREKAA